MAKHRSRVELIETAMKLFAEKGYHATSIQDIVEAWGISKGAFYHHFSSKEELILSVVKHHLDKLFSRFIDAKQQGESQKELFIKQLQIQLEGIRSQRDFFHMIMAEQLPKISEDLRCYMFAQRSRIFNWYCQRLIDVYGDKVKKHVFDIAAILSGILREYVFYMMFYQEMLRPEDIAPFIIRRIDAIVAHFKEHEEPLLKEEAIRYFKEIEERERHQRKQQIIGQIANLKEAVSALSLDKKTHHQLHSALDTLEAEFMNEQSAPREYVVKGILLYVESLHIQRLTEALASLTKLVHEYMTHHNNHNR
ncbi:TetR/AcrR family transcriptional regulator [Anoxybacteroides tepidamans]|uniref:TetR/AcrR family transcriptional regulator n=1 Tax=Anoxybacteroides tepidamans TaxID=265948 RepID=UPI0004856B81|nr:TetR/AcrR family transcriptional regulator [Anoxybacillus tepidamans]